MKDDTGKWAALSIIIGTLTVAANFLLYLHLAFKHHRLVPSLNDLFRGENEVPLLRAFLVLSLGLLMVNLFIASVIRNERTQNFTNSRNLMSAYVGTAINLLGTLILLFPFTS